jgi:hypothetical protein
VLLQRVSLRRKNTAEQQNLAQHSIDTPTFSKFAHLIAIFTGALAVYLVLFDPEFYLDRFVAKDGAETTGIAEHLTWIILLPGIALAFMASVRFATTLPKTSNTWLLLWAAACIYFAGEEASWGQWYFLWETPEGFAQINDQQETNLHNTSSWFDQKPRLAVELFVLIGGVIWPILRRFGRTPAWDTTNFRYWVTVPDACFSAALLFTLVRICDWSSNPVLQNFGNSEFRELTIALFLTLYLSSFWVRLKTLSRA